MRQRVMSMHAGLPRKLWAEAMHHGNCLRNRLSSTRASDHLLILLWKPNTTLQYDIPTVGKPGFAFIYRSKTAPDKKFNACSAHVYFVGMQRDERLCRVWDSQKDSVSIVRLAEFRPCKQEQLLGIKSLLDGLSRQSMLEAQEGDDGVAEEGFIQAFIASTLSPVCFATKVLDPGVPRSLNIAVRFPKKSFYRPGVLETPQSLELDLCITHGRHDDCTIHVDHPAQTTRRCWYHVLREVAMLYLRKPTNYGARLRPAHGLRSRHVIRGCSYPTRCGCCTWPHLRKRGYKQRVSIWRH